MDRLPTPVFLGFLCDSTSKESACNAGDLVLTPGLGRSPGEGKDYSLQNSGLEIYTGCIVQGVTKSRTWLRNFHCSRLMNQTFMIETPEIPLIPILFTRLQGYKVPSVGSHQSAITEQCLTYTSLTFCPFPSPITAFISNLDYNSFLSSHISNLPMPIHVTKSFP